MNSPVLNNNHDLFLMCALLYRFLAYTFLINKLYLLSLKLSDSDVTIIIIIFDKRSVISLTGGTEKMNNINNNDTLSIYRFIHFIYLSLSLHDPGAFQGLKAEAPLAANSKTAHCI